MACLYFIVDCRYRPERPLKNKLIERNLLFQILELTNDYFSRMSGMFLICLLGVLPQLYCFKYRCRNRTGTTLIANIAHTCPLPKSSQYIGSSTKSTILSTEETSMCRKTFKTHFPPVRPIRRIDFNKNNRFLHVTVTEGWSHETMDYILRHHSKNFFNKSFYDMFPESAAKFCLKSTQKNKYTFFFECSSTINWRPEFSEIRNYFGTTKILVFFQLFYASSLGNASLNVPGIKYTILTQSQPPSPSMKLWRTEGWLHSKRNHGDMKPERYRKPHRFYRFPYWDENMVYRMKKNIASHGTWSDYVSWNPARHTLLSRYFGTTKILVKFYGLDNYKYILITQSQPRWPKRTTVKIKANMSKPHYLNTSSTRIAVLPLRSGAPRAALRNSRRTKTTQSRLTKDPNRTRRTRSRTIKTIVSSFRPWWFTRKFRTTVPTRKVYTTTTTKIIQNCKSKCYVCGLNFTGIPDPICHQVFSSGNMRYQKRKRKYKTHCYYHAEKWQSSRHVIYGPTFIGGCFYRTLDIGKTYDERGCRTWPPDEGISFASRRFAYLERMLRVQTDGCMTSPFASLTPFSRGISLYARYKACVCIGNFCNDAYLILPSLLIRSLLVFIIFFQMLVTNF